MSTRATLAAALSLALCSCDSPQPADAVITTILTVDVQVHPGATLCDVRGRQMPCAESGAYLHDVLRIPIGQELFLVVIDSAASIEKLPALDSALRAAGYSKFKYLMDGADSEQKHNAGGS